MSASGAELRAVSPLERLEVVARLVEPEPAATALNTDTAGTEIRWSESTGRNQLRARREGWFPMGVYRRRGVVVVDTAIWGHDALLGGR